MARTVEVSSHCRRWMISEAAVVSLYQRLDQNPRYTIGPGVLSVAFVSVSRMRALHQRFLQDASLTDVITFPGDSQFDLAGEVVICPAYAEQQAKRFRTGLDDEVKLYLIHGFLHLSGLNDKTPEECTMMRAAEAYCQEFSKGLPEVVC